MLKILRSTWSLLCAFRWKSKKGLRQNRQSKKIKRLISTYHCLTSRPVFLGKRMDRLRCERFHLHWWAYLLKASCNLTQKLERKFQLEMLSYWLHGLPQQKSRLLVSDSKTQRLHILGQRLTPLQKISSQIRIFISSIKSLWHLHASQTLWIALQIC